MRGAMLPPEGMLSRYFGKGKERSFLLNGLSYTNDLELWATATLAGISIRHEATATGISGIDEGSKMKIQNDRISGRNCWGRIK